MTFSQDFLFLSWLICCLYLCFRSIYYTRFSIIDGLVVVFTLGPLSVVPLDLPGDFYYYRTHYTTFDKWEPLRQGWPPLFNFIIFILNKIFSGEVVGYYISRLIPTIFITFAFVAFRVPVFLSLIFFALIALIPALTITRFYYSIAIAFTAFLALQKNRLILSYFLILLSIGCHLSALAALPLFAKNELITPKVNHIGSFLIAILSVFIIAIFLNGPLYDVIVLKITERSKLDSAIPLRIISFIVCVMLVFVTSKSTRNIIIHIGYIKFIYIIILTLVSIQYYGISRIFIFMQLYLLSILCDIPDKAYGSIMILNVLSFFGLLYFFLIYRVPGF